MYNPKKELDIQMMTTMGKVNEYPVGSEEYLNACKATNQLAEASQKCRRLDINQLIPGVASVGMFVIYMIFNEKHITDTRGIQFVKGLFKR